MEEDTIDRGLVFLMSTMDSCHIRLQCPIIRMTIAAHMVFPCRILRLLIGRLQIPLFVALTVILPSYMESLTDI